MESPVTCAQEAYNLHLPTARDSWHFNVLPPVMFLFLAKNYYCILHVTLKLSVSVTLKITLAL